LPALGAAGAGPFITLTGCENHQLFGWAGSRLGCRRAPRPSSPHGSHSRFGGGAVCVPGRRWGGGERCPHPSRASPWHAGSRDGAPSQTDRFHPKPAVFGSAAPWTAGTWGWTQLSAVASPCTIPPLQPTSQSRVAAVHRPGYGACKWLFLRQGTSLSHRASVRGDKRNTWLVTNSPGLAAPRLCCQCHLHRLTARSELVVSEAVKT